MHPNAITFESGQRFGRLTVLNVLEERAGAHIQWLCKCDCGNEFKAKAGNLRSGDVRSCGCLAREWRENCPNVKDLSGQRFGKLLVMSRHGEDSKRHVTWKCKCDCGFEKIVSGVSLRAGKSTCCGCSASRTVSGAPNDGTKLCSSCKERKPLSSFEKAPRCWMGVTKQCKSCRSKSKVGDWLKWRYGITKSQFEEMKSKQDGRCAICLKPTQKLCVDHCHSTGRVRGLLCGHCNAAIGMFGENETTMRRAIEYLKQPADSTAILFAQPK